MSKNAPLVSILIPVFNVEKYVLTAVNSIRTQTYKNIEIIIVDDCSTDDTYRICLDLAKADSRIKLFRNEHNQKIALTLNKAYFESRGEYIARMDGDDISQPDRIQRQVEFLESNPLIDLVGVSLIAINEAGNVISKFTHLSDFVALKRTIRYVTPVSHVWVAKRIVYEELNGYRNIPGCEDYDFLLRMLTSKLTFSNVPDYYGYFVRLQRQGNTPSMLGLRQRKLFNYVYKLYKERVAFGTDSFSEQALEQAVSANRLANLLFKASNNFLSKAITARANQAWWRVLTYGFAALISPHQIHYLYLRVRYRLLARKS